MISPSPSGDTIKPTDSPSEPLESFVKATIYEVQRADQTINVLVLFEDKAVGFAEKRVLNFHDFDVQKIQDEIIRMGRSLLNALNAEDTIKQLLNLEIEIKAAETK